MVSKIVRGHWGFCNQFAGKIVQSLKLSYLHFTGFTCKYVIPILEKEVCKYVSHVYLIVWLSIYLPLPPLYLRTATKAETLILIDSFVATADAYTWGDGKIPRYGSIDFTIAAERFY